jgi:hypothetical protein
MSWGEGLDGRAIQIALAEPPFHGRPYEKDFPVAPLLDEMASDLELALADEVSDGLLCIANPGAQVR